MILNIDAILPTFISLVLLVFSVEFITVFVAVINGIFIIGKIKREITTHFNGSFIKYVKSFIKKNP